MIRELRVCLRVARMEWVVLLVGIGAGLALGLGMDALLYGLLSLPEEEFFPMGVLFSIMGVLVGVLVSRNLNGSTRYALAVSMGQTRRGFLLGEVLLRLLLGMAGGALCLWVLLPLESALLSALLPRSENVLGPFLTPAALPWQLLCILLTALVLLAVDLLLCAAMVRFGNQGLLLVVLPCWLLPTLGSLAVPAAQAGEENPLAWVGSLLLAVGDFLLTPAGLALLAAALLAALVLSVVYLLRAPARL